MPTGDYYIDDTSLRELREALRESKGGLKDLRGAYRHIAEDAQGDVGRRTPYGRNSPKDSRGHRSPGYLRSTVKSGATINGPWVSAGDARTPDIILHEFGGKSYWHRAGAGAFRSVNRAHEAVSVLQRDSRGRAVTIGTSRVGTKGHIVYEKKRERRGYFIWNVAFRLRSRIGMRLHDEIGAVCRKHGLPYEMPGNPDIGVTPQTWTGGKAA